uniref:Uncharacterized protein n=1 Tax=Anguilla anguilla TaxID=7936 RepID=A0A0E9WQP7_ANGAN
MTLVFHEQCFSVLTNYSPNPFKNKSYTHITHLKEKEGEKSSVKGKGLTL